MDAQEFQGFISIVVVVLIVSTIGLKGIFDIVKGLVSRDKE